MLQSSLKAGFADAGIGQSSYMRKFFKEAHFVPVQPKKHPLHNYQIKLDGKKMKTPYMNVLAVPSKALAMLVATQFNRQQKHLKPGEMPILSMCRTAVDADLEGHLAQHLKHAIYEYLKTDTMLFTSPNYVDMHGKLAQGLIQDFNDKFGMKMKASDSIYPPEFTISDSFNEWIDGLNNWELIGIETMAIWLKSTIGSSSIANHNRVVKEVRKAATLQETIQMAQSGEVQEKIMDFNQIQLMVSCGEILYRLGKSDLV